MRFRRSRKKQPAATVSGATFGVAFEWDETYLAASGPTQLTLTISRPPTVSWRLVRAGEPGRIRERETTQAETAAIAGMFRSWQDDPRSQAASEATALRAAGLALIQFDRLQVSFGPSDFQPVDPPGHTFARTLQFLASAAQQLEFDPGEEAVEELAMLYQLEHLSGQLIIGPG